MMIWLYIFQKKAIYNPLYEAGFERIGCMFCPASTMSELTIIAEQCPDEWHRWQSNAAKIAQRNGMSQKWLDHGFWRWKNYPPKIKELAQKMEIDLQPLHKQKTDELLSFVIKPTEQQEKGLINGKFSKPIDLLRASSFLPALGDVILDFERKIVEVTISKKKSLIKASLFEGGQFTISGPATEKIANTFARTVLRGVLCTACGTCQSLCPNEAISIDKHARIIEENCNQCKECIRGKCPSLFVQ
jgi:phosphoadenosine phosphosulfate reductase